MALYNELKIYKDGCALLALALDIQTQLPRTFKRSLGEKVHTLCVDMLEDMAMANAARDHERVAQIDSLLKRLRTVTALLRVAHEMRAPGPVISTKLWARSVELLDDVGKQAGGWRKYTLENLSSAPAA